MYFIKLRTNEEKQTNENGVITEKTRLLNYLKAVYCVFVIYTSLN